MTVIASRSARNPWLKTLSLSPTVYCLRNPPSSLKLLQRIKLCQRLSLTKEAKFRSRTVSPIWSAITTVKTSISQSEVKMTKQNHLNSAHHVINCRIKLTNWRSQSVRKVKRIQMTILRSLSGSQWTHSRRQCKIRHQRWRQWRKNLLIKALKRASSKMNTPSHMSRRQRHQRSLRSNLCPRKTSRSMSLWKISIGKLVSTNSLCQVNRSTVKINSMNRSPSTQNPYKKRNLSMIV